MAASLSENGWAVAEFITPDAVSVVRDEIKNIAPYYTDGEIWLGKGDAGRGSHSSTSQLNLSRLDQ
jgi:hypoxia-inducible factor (prolyl hydroxylase)